MSKVALVTGANRGIGLAIAQKLHDDGFIVVGTHRSSPAQEAKFHSVLCDITVPESIESAFSSVEEQFGSVQVLVANAGITKDNLLPRMTDDDFISVIEANLISAYRIAKRAIKPMMKENQRKGTRLLFPSKPKNRYSKLCMWEGILL